MGLQGPPRSIGVALIASMLVGCLGLGLILPSAQPSAVPPRSTVPAGLSGSTVASTWLVTGPRQVVLTPSGYGGLDGVRVFQPSVIRALNGTYLMYYTGYDGSRDHLMAAWSADGLAWTRLGEVVWLNDGSGSPFALVVAGTYHLWFESVVWGPGPLGYTDQIYHMTSRDGLTWSAPTLALPVGAVSAWDGGSVGDPSVARDAFGTYRMYFTMYAANYSTAVGVALSSDLVNWTKWPGNPVLLPGPVGSWDDAGVSNPSAVSGSAWTLFVYGRQNGSAGEIGVATSSDGYHWGQGATLFLPPDAAGTWDSAAVGSPEFFGGAAAPRLYYNGYAVPGGSSIGTVALQDVVQAAAGATSWTVGGNAFQDGGMDRATVAANGSLALGPFPPPLNRTMVLDVGPAGSADSSSLYSECVLRETNGTYKMYYTGYDGSVNQILLATSSDGLTWSKQGIVLSPYPSGASPFVVKLGSTYHMWYEITASGGPLGWNNQVYHATSLDGIAWTAGGLALGLGASGAWDAASVSDPHVIVDGSGLYRMYYTGTDTLQDAEVGVATSTDLVNWTRYAGNPVLPFGPSGAWDNPHVAYPSVTLSGTAWTMYYYGFANGSGASIGRAFSSDGYNWAKDGGNPILGPEPSPAWDERSVAMPDLLADPSGPRLYYRGDDGSVSRIGLYRFGTLPPVGASAAYASAVFDSSSNGTNWASLAWHGDAPPGTTLAIAVRVGSTPLPGAAWTAWANLTPAGATEPPSGVPLSLPRYRYLQFAVNLTSVNGSLVPWAQSVNVTFAGDGGPTSTAVAPVAGTWTNVTRPVLRWTATDPEGDPVQAAQVQVSTSSDFATLAAASGTLSGNASSWQVPIALAEGSWSWRVRSQDIYGIWGPWVSSGFAIDTTPPALTVTSPAPGAFVDSRSLQVTWLAHDGGSGLADVEVAADGGAPLLVTPGNTTAVLTGLVDGNHTVTVRAFDRAGNFDTVSLAVTVDTTPPTITITSPAPGTLFHSGTVQVSWATRDAVSGINRTTISVDGGASIVLPPGASSMNLTDLSDGAHAVLVTVTDRAGNTQTATTTWTVDTQVLSLTGPYGPWALVALAGAILAAVGVGAYLVLRSRRKANPPAP